MKDILFVIIFFGCLIMAFKRPYIGTGMWVWTALLFPNLVLWGFASNIRYNFVVSITVLFVLLFKSKAFQNLKNPLFWVSLLFLIWTLICSALALGNSEVVALEQGNFIKVFLLFVAALLTIDSKHKLNIVIAFMICGIGYFISTEGSKVILSLGRHHVWGPAQSIIGDNNHFALATLMTIPLSIYLYRHFSDNHIIKKGLLAFILISFAAVFGTYSRGGLIGLLVFAATFAVYFKKKALVFNLGLVIVISYGIFVPQQWSERMNTIKKADEDGSFMGRVIAWKQSTLVALDRPLIGGGFKAIENFPIWLLYAQEFDKLDFIPTSEPDTLRPHAAHSIYFQVLGEQGFVGLFLFLLMIYLSLRNTGLTRKSIDEKNEELRWIRELALAIRTSIIVYCCSGAALNLAYFDMIYVLFALSIIQLQLMKNSLEVK